MKEKKIFEQYVSCSSPKTIVYLANGIMLDPKNMLAEYNLLQNVDIYLMHYQRANSMEQLLKEWLSHLDSASKEQLSIILVGFSSGGLVIHRIMALLDDMTKLKLISISIAPSHIENYEPLKSYSVDFLDNLSEKAGHRILRRMPWYIKSSSLKYDEIIKQLRLFVQDKIYEKPLGKVDIIVIPNQDKLCFNKEKAIEYANKIEFVEGTHNINKLPLVEIIKKYL